MNYGASRRVLVIDDQEAIHHDLAKVLATGRPSDGALEQSRGNLFGAPGPRMQDEAPYDLCCVTQGREALERAREAAREQRPFAVAIIDSRMPEGWDGLTTIQHLWREFPDLQVILCTAFSDHTWEEIVRRLGRTDSLLIVKKPFDAIEIRQAVCALSRKWQLARESQVRLDELRKAQRQVQAIIDFAPSLICLRGLDGRFLLVNGCFCHLFGVTRESIFGRTAPQVLPQILASRLAERDEEVLRQGRTLEWEIDLPLATDNRTLLVTKFPLYGMDGAPYAIASVMTDLSRRKVKEEHERHHLTMNALARMAGTVAHDFNNLMTAVVGHHDLALRRIEGPHPLRKSLEEIGKAATQAAALADRLLRFSRRQVSTPVVCDLARALRQWQPSLQSLLGPEVILDLALPDVALEVLIDPEHLDLVLQDLATLAKEGGCHRLHLAITTVEPAVTRAGPEVSRQVQLLIRDDGRGLPLERLTTIFDPFMTGGGGLAGLGLASTKAVMSQSGGSISVVSQPGSTTFTLLFPKVDGGSAQLTESPARVTGTGQATILVAEDEEAVRELIVEALEEEGFHVLTGGDGQEALGAAWSHAGPIDLLITDAIMPRLSGAALADRLIARHPHLRVVFMSGYTESQAIRHQIPEGRAFYLQKPFGMAELVQRARQALAGRSATNTWTRGTAQG